VTFQRSPILRNAGLTLAILAGFAPLRAQTDKYTSGEMQFSVGEEHYQIPLSKLADASSLMSMGGGKGLLGLVYTAEKEQGPVRPNARFALNVAGPGKYDKTAIMNFVVQTGIRPWNFSRSTDDCVINLTRVDKSGVEGSVTCTNAVPFTAMKFSAKP